MKLIQPHRDIADLASQSHRVAVETNSSHQRCFALDAANDVVVVDSEDNLARTARIHDLFWRRDASTLGRPRQHPDGTVTCSARLSAIESTPPSRCG